MATKAQLAGLKRAREARAAKRDDGDLVVVNVPSVPAPRRTATFKKRMVVLLVAIGAALGGAVLALSPATAKDEEDEDADDPVLPPPPEDEPEPEPEPEPDPLDQVECDDENPCPDPLVCVDGLCLFPEEGDPGDDDGGDGGDGEAGDGGGGGGDGGGEGSGDGGNGGEDGGVLVPCSDASIDDATRTLALSKILKNIQNATEPQLMVEEGFSFPAGDWSALRDYYADAAIVYAFTDLELDIEFMHSGQVNGNPCYFDVPSQVALRLDARALWDQYHPGGQI